MTSNLCGQVLPPLQSVRGDVPDAPDPEELGVDHGWHNRVEYQDQNQLQEEKFSPFSVRLFCFIMALDSIVLPVDSTAC